MSIGFGTRISHGSILNKNIYIGRYCDITACTIKDYVSIGNFCSLGPGEHELNGKYLSQKINSYIRENSGIKVNLHFIDIDKKNLSVKEISFESDADEIKDKVIVLVDDVMNSASTLMYSINEILKYQPKEIQVAVLIERYYKSFPITPNFRGLELSTSKSEHVQVDLGNSPKVLIL